MLYQEVEAQIITIPNNMAVAIRTWSVAFYSVYCETYY